MTFAEAQAKSLTVKWKTSVCMDGPECWCRSVETVEPILFEDKDDDGYQFNGEVELIGSATISKIHAEHIVKIHNEYIDKQNETT